LESCAGHHPGGAQRPRTLNRRTALGLTGASIALSLRAMPVGAQTPAPLRVGASTDDGIWPMLYALQAGLFQKAGLDVRLTPLANGAALAAAVIGGTVDIGKSSLMVLITAHQRGVHFKLVAGAAFHDNRDQSDQLLVLKDSPITSLGQAGGKTVAVNVLQSLDQYGTAQLIDKRGGDSSTVRWVEMPYTAMPPALDQGRADIASIGNPVLAVALDGGKLRSLGVPYDGIAPRFLIAGWFCTEQYLAANRAIVDRFSSAMHQATIYANEHHQELVPIVAAYTKIDPEALKKKTFVTNAPTVDASMIQPSIDLALKFKLIDRGFPATDLIAGGAS
jgi:NitT/TauT family transport system substrate-binding protein